MTTYLVYSGASRLSHYLNWARRNLGDALTIPSSKLMPIEVSLNALAPKQRAFLDDLLARTGGLDGVVVAPDDPAEAVLASEEAAACALEASRRDWTLGGTPRVEWMVEYPRCWAVSLWCLQNMPPGNAYLIDKASHRAFEQHHFQMGYESGPKEHPR